MGWITRRGRRSVQNQSGECKKTPDDLDWGIDRGTREKTGREPKRDLTTTPQIMEMGEVPMA